MYVCQFPSVSWREKLCYDGAIATEMIARCFVLHISVVGCGRWGSFIAWYLDHIGHSILLYGRPGSTHMQTFMRTRSNGLLTLPPSVRLTNHLSQALGWGDAMILSIGVQNVRDFLRSLPPKALTGKTLVLCMKGLEAATGKRLTEIVREECGHDFDLAIWVGPGHVQDFLQSRPNCMVIDSADQAVTARLIPLLSSDLIRFYYGRDLIGNEIGAAAKNVIGIAAGLLDGLDRASLKGALMSRGTREVARLIQAMGGNPQSAYGLAHLGDYEATVFSPFSHNRMFGESFARHQPYDSLAEGVPTTQALMVLAQQHHVDLPICQAVYEVLYQHRSLPTVLSNLFLRSLKEE